MSQVNISLANVRLSYPSLFTPSQGMKGDPNSKPAYQASFILDKKINAKEIAAINKAIDQITRDDFKGKRPPKVCLRDGSEKDGTDGYSDDVMFVSARCDKRPQVVNRDMSPLTDEDNVIFAGCYVNATIQLWAQDNQYGKRINAKLRAIQYYKKGAPFGEAPVDVNKEFKAIDGDEDDETSAI